MPGAEPGRQPVRRDQRREQRREVALVPRTASRTSGVSRMPLMNRYVAQTVNTVAWTPGATHQRSSRRVLPRPEGGRARRLAGQPEAGRDARHRAAEVAGVAPRRSTIASAKPCVPGRPAEVVGRPPALRDDVADRRLEATGLLGVAEVAEHQRPGQDHRGRVGAVEAGVLRRRAVDRLEDGRLGRRCWRPARRPGRRPGRRTGRSRCRRTGSAGPSRRTARASGPAACTCCRRSGPRTRSGPRSRPRPSGSSRGTGRPTAS